LGGFLRTGTLFIDALIKIFCSAFVIDQLLSTWRILLGIREQREGVHEMSEFADGFFGGTQMPKC
jgi:hypothetical protein